MAIVKIEDGDGHVVWKRSGTINRIEVVRKGERMSRESYVEVYVDADRVAMFAEWDEAMEFADDIAYRINEAERPAHVYIGGNIEVAAGANAPGVVVGKTWNPDAK